MKSTIKLIIYTISFILLSFAGDVKADELVRNVIENTTTRTIIRHYDDGLDVACYHSPKPFFMVYKEGVPLSNAIYMDHMDSVFDFEIYNDTVYFCGEGSYYSFHNNAAVGYFDIPSLISSTPTNVSYISLPLMKKVTALEVDWFASRKHVVGIGVGQNFESKMVDMIDETPQWKVNYSDVGGDTILLSDLAITNNYVVVTSTKTGLWFIPTGYLWYISKPTTPGQSLFPCNVYYKSHPRIVGTQYSIRHIIGDEFATAYYYYLIPPTTKSLVISCFTGLTYDRGVILDAEPMNSYSLQDIETEFTTRTIEVLTSGTYSGPSGTTIRSKIYEILSASPLPTTVYAHFYDGVFLTSIDDIIIPFTIGEGHFVMSGSNSIYGMGTPYYVKFKHQRFSGACLDKTECAAENFNLKSDAHEGYLNSTITIQTPDVMQYWKKEETVETKCYFHSPTPYNEDEQEKK